MMPDHSSPEDLESKTTKNPNSNVPKTSEGASALRRAPSKIPRLKSRLAIVGQRDSFPRSGQSCDLLRAAAPRVAPRGLSRLGNINSAPLNPDHPLDGRIPFAKQGSRPFFLGQTPKMAIYPPSLPAVIERGPPLTYSDSSLSMASVPCIFSRIIVPPMILTG